MRVVLITIVIILMSLLLAGCGIPEQKYNAILSERDAAQTQVTSVQGELDLARTQAASLQDDLDKTKTQAAIVQGDLDTTKAQAAIVQGDLDKAKAQTTLVQGDLESAKAQVKAFQDEVAGIKTKLADLDASTTKQIDAMKQEIEKLKRLTHTKAVFCLSKPDANKYTVKPDNTYKVGESVWIYDELIGNKYVVIDQKLHADVDNEFKVLNDKGEVVSLLVIPLKKDFDRPQTYFWYYREIRDLKAGNYTFEISAQDNLSGETAVWRGSFKVVP